MKIQKMTINELNMLRGMILHGQLTIIKIYLNDRFLALGDFLKLAEYAKTQGQQEIVEFLNGYIENQRFDKFNRPWMKEREK